MKIYFGMLKHNVFPVDFSFSVLMKCVVLLWVML